jgi:peptidoglycan/xylan/chitin deacetylase (PgdA/CDA1 family)
MNWFAYTTIWAAGIGGTIAALVPDPTLKNVLLFALLLIYLLTLAGGAGAPQADFYLETLHRGSAAFGQIALTFDGGPHPELTPRLLEILRRERVAATFFFRGADAAGQTVLVRRTDAEGHLVGAHVGSNVRSLWFSSALERDVVDTAQILTRILRRRPCFVRLGAGAPRPGLGRGLQRLNLVPVGWDVGGPRSLTTPEAARKMAQRVRNGSVVRIPTWQPAQNTVQTATACLAAIKRMIQLLRDRGFAFGRLDALLELPGYEEES